MLDSTTLTTRRLASEQQAAETADQAAARRQKAAFEAKVKADVLGSLANFKCDTCAGKQYPNARLYNEVGAPLVWFGLCIVQLLPPLVCLPALAPLVAPT